MNCKKNHSCVKQIICTSRLSNKNIGTMAVIVFWWFLGKIYYINNDNNQNMNNKFVKKLLQKCHIDKNSDEDDVSPKMNVIRC